MRVVVVLVALAVTITVTGCGARTGLGPISESDAGAHADASTPTCVATSPIAIASTGAKPDAIALDGAYVYWHDASGVSRAPKAGGATESIAHASALFWPSLAPFAVGGGNVFYTDGTTFSRVPESSGASEPVGFGGPTSLAASATHVYFWSASDNGVPIVQLDFDGLGATTVATVGEFPNAMTFFGGRAYAAADPGVYVLDLAGDATLLSGLTATDVAADEAHVYFTSNDPTNGARVIVLDQSTLATTKIDDTFGAFALALDAHDLYFTDSNSGRVRRIAGKTGPVSDVASTGQDFEPLDIALDDGCIYWSSAPRASMSAPGAIFAAPKR